MRVNNISNLQFGSKATSMSTMISICALRDASVDRTTLFLESKQKIGCMNFPDELTTFSGSAANRDTRSIAIEQSALHAGRAENFYENEGKIMQSTIEK